MYTLDFFESIGSFFKSIKDWFLANNTNPLLWLGIVLGVLAIFGIAYTALHGRD